MSPQSSDPAASCDADDALTATRIERLLAQHAASWHVRVVDTTGSTNTALLADVRRGSGRGGFGSPGLPALLAARHQLAGRGRLGRTWLSTAGASLTVSFGLAVARRMASLEGVTLVCGLAVAHVIAALGVPARLKWPNDVLVDQRKLAGILVEAHATGDKTGLVVGVGINLHSAMDPVGGIAAIGLREAGVVAPDRNALVAALAVALGERLAIFERDGFAPFAPAWRAVDAFAGRPVAVRVADEAPVAGIAAGIDPTGALLVDVHGELRRFTGGDISLRLSS